MKGLRDDKAIKCSGKNDKSILVQHGYFNLVNGYKLPFTTSRTPSRAHIYETGTSLNELLAVKKFDDELRLVLFKQISRIEEEVRTLVGYQFDLINNNGTIEWFQIGAYDIKRNEKKDIAVFISRLLGDIKVSRSDYLEHYRTKHDIIPTWILVKVIRLSTFIHFVSKSKTPIRKEICKIYNMIDKRGYSHYKLLKGSLHFMREIRNACAHNERVFDIKSFHRISCEYFKYLPKAYEKTSTVDKSLLDFIIYTRYYLNNDSYYNFIDELYRLLRTLEKQIPQSSFDYVRGKMGIRDKEHLLLLKSISKTIDYSTFA